MILITKIASLRPSIQMKVSELPSLKSLRKLILMSLMRNIAHSDQDLKPCSFSCRIPECLSYRELHSCMPKFLPIDQADYWPHTEISQGKKPNIPFSARWIRFPWDPFRNFCTLAPNVVLQSKLTHRAEHNCPNKSTDPQDHTTTF